jgi:glycosyltransferase involved in cell wall biosynthesis
MGPGQKEYEVIDGVHYHRCSFGFNPNLIQEMHNMSKSMANAFFGCDNYSGGFDIIHGHDWHVVPALDEIKKTRNKRTIWTLHSNQYGRDGNQFHNGGAEAIHGLEWHGTYISDRLITCTQKMKDETKWIHKVPEDKIRVIHNGIQINKFNGFVDPGKVKSKYNIGPMDPTIVFCGRMTYQKGPDLLVEAIPGVLNDYPNVRFVFIGKGDMKNHLMNRVQHLGVAHATRFTGYLSENDKIDIMKSCDAVCVPSRNEPFGIIVLEAWAAEKPVIAIHGTGAGDIVWHDATGLKVYGYPNSIAWGVKSIFSDFDKARQMGKNGRHAAEKEFNWDKISKETLNVYQEVM